jgi:hypothetical protein
MPRETGCVCSLCRIEEFLRTEIDSARDLFTEFKSSMSMPLWHSAAEVLSVIRESSIEAGSDKIMANLFRFRLAQPAFVDSFLVLAFIPMLHRLVRRVQLHQPALLEDDVVQQTLKTLLHFLGSDDLEHRRSHFAFAISRAVKRDTFLWAAREGTRQQLLDHASDDLTAGAGESFERHAQLRHFLHRAVEGGTLTPSELDLLIQFKLEGVNGTGLSGAKGHSSNSQRQKLKRLLARLRRLAR